MDVNAPDPVQRQARPIRSLEPDPYPPRLPPWEERASRRYSIADATIRAVPPDWEDDGTTATRPRLRETEDITSSLPRPSRQWQTEVEVESLPVKHGHGLGAANAADKASRAFFVRSRTRTLDDGRREGRRHAVVDQRVDVDVAPSLGPMAHSPSALSRTESWAVSAPSPSPAVEAQDLLSEARASRRNRYRGPSGPVPTSPTGEAAIIKVGKLLCWITVPTLSAPPRKSRTAAAPPRRTKPRHHEWQTVSAVLRVNGGLKLFVADVNVVASIRLSQLSRGAIQQLHPSVLDERFCIAIYPQYALSSGAMTPARPCYVATESRVLFEAWWALLRAFAAPDLHGPAPITPQGTLEDGQPVDQAHPSLVQDMFRLERSVSLRVIEARLRPSRPRTSEKGPAFRSSSAGKEAGSRERYFVEVLMDGIVKARTVSREDSQSLFWREDYDFLELPKSVTGATLVLKKHTLGSSHDKGQPDIAGLATRPGSDAVTCGKVHIDFAQKATDDGIEAWHPILNHDKETIGDVLLRVRTEEVTVMMLDEYQPLRRLLHHSHELAPQMARMVPRKLHRLSELLVNIFQVSGHLNDWLMILAESEIEAAYQKTATSRSRSISRAGSDGSFDSAGERELVNHELGKAMSNEVSLLFRGNTLLTRSVDYYMRLVGKEYLEDTLREVLVTINESGDDCEVDPTRVQTPEHVARNWSSLVKHFRGVWTAIRESGSRCPREMRLLLRHIRAHCDDRFGSYHHTVRYSSVSGFLFLRFFCPAVLNPKLFGLLRDHPRPTPQRTFTLIAKSLQGLANMSTFGSKESWMEPMNNHLVVHRSEFRELVDRICSVSPTDPSSHSTETPPSYATPKTILTRLPLTHREGFPSLPYLIDEARNYASLVDLWLDSEPDLDAVHGAQGHLPSFHELCVYLRRRTQECMLAGGDDHDRKDDVAQLLRQPRILPVIPSLERDARPRAEPRRNTSSLSIPTTTTSLSNESNAVAGIISTPARPSTAGSSPTHHPRHQHHHHAHQHHQSFYIPTAKRSRDMLRPNTSDRDRTSNHVRSSTPARTAIYMPPGEHLQDNGEIRRPHEYRMEEEDGTTLEKFNSIPSLLNGRPGSRPGSGPASSATFGPPNVGRGPTSHPTSNPPFHPISSDHPVHSTSGTGPVPRPGLVSRSDSDASTTSGGASPNNTVNGKPKQLFSEFVTSLWGRKR